MGAPAGLLIAALILAIALAACAVARKPPRGDGFMRGNEYRPACGARWLQNRVRECKGETTGEMPSIETTPYLSWFPCCGSLGVPPPTFE